jgi:hypothetical protein
MHGNGSAPDDPMSWLDWFELFSYVVTIIGLPLAIAVFIYEQRKERQTDEEEVYQRLSDEYAEFLKLILQHTDLHIFRQHDGPALPLSDEQEERKYVIFGLLVALFERAYLLVYEERMNKHTRRLWQSWDDYMREWCRREDFRSTLPYHLEGEDPDFRSYIEKIAADERSAVRTPSSQWRKAKSSRLAPIDPRRP